MVDTKNHYNIHYQTKLATEVLPNEKPQRPVFFYFYLKYFAIKELVGARQVVIQLRGLVVIQ